MKKVFITFGGPSENYHEAVKRLCTQAKSLDIFDEIIGYTEKDLEKFPEFWFKHRDFIKNNSRGYGYWIWRSFLLLEKIKQLENGDVVLFLDAGCEMNPRGKKILEDLIQRKDFHLLGKRAKSNDLMYSKQDLIDKIGVFDERELQLPQMEAGVVVVKTNEKTRNFFTELKHLCEDYHLIDDSKSYLSENKSFREHRHDQSVFSLLAKKHLLLNYELTDYCFDNNRIFGNKNMPFFVIRNRTGESRIDQVLGYYPDWLVGVFGLFGRGLKKIFPKIYQKIKRFFPDQNIIC